MVADFAVQEEPSSSSEVMIESSSRNGPKDDSGDDDEEAAAAAAAAAVTTAATLIETKSAEDIAIDKPVKVKKKKQSLIPQHHKHISHQIYYWIRPGEAVP